MDFAVLPPEVISGRMYVGAGSGPLVGAAAAWGALAQTLSFTASSYRAVVSELAGGPWLGPSSLSMVAAVAPYVSWLSSSAEQVGQTASQAGLAVAAYEAAFAVTVPPAEIELNRALLASLVATNVFGQNTPAIAATEAQYAQMWAQDVSMMQGYAEASAAATRLTPFTAPSQSTNPDGTANQGTSVGEAAASAAGPGAQSALSNVPSMLQRASAGTTSESSQTSSAPASILDLFNNFSANTVGYQILSEGLNFDASGALLTLDPPVAAAWNPLVSALSAPATAASAASDVSGSALASSTGVSGPAAAGLGNGVAAGLGQSASVGGLSVPQTWDTSTPIRLAASESSTAGLDALPRAGAFYGGMPTMGPVASVVNAPRGEQDRLRAGARHKAIPAVAGASGMHDDPAGRWIEPTDLDDDGPISERDELNQLRKAIVDVTRQRDVLKRTAATLIQEATHK
ncbi:PPE family protein [Mycobacterium simiae]|uniref:PPE family protein n=1 Tax=Mycobacterium simiae TaxID=1784 RepID=UPI00261B1AE9|nr:PPE family protein [Mycobacterium simiae]